MNKRRRYKAKRRRALARGWSLLFTLPIPSDAERRFLAHLDAECLRQAQQVAVMFGVPAHLVVDVPRRSLILMAEVERIR